MRRIFDLVSPLLIERIRITFLGLAQNLAHDAATSTPKSLVLRARAHFLLAHSSTLVESNFVEFPETRKTYRAVFSEPKLVIPGTSVVESTEGGDSLETKSSGEQLPAAEAKQTAVTQAVPVAGSSTAQLEGRKPKRSRDIAEVADCNTVGGARKRKRSKKSG